jgi:hypothetical protein
LKKKKSTVEPPLPDPRNMVDFSGHRFRRVCDIDSREARAEGNEDLWFEKARKFGAEISDELPFDVPTGS